MIAFDEIWYAIQSPGVRKTLMKSKWTPELPARLLRQATEEVDDQIREAMGAPSTSRHASPILQNYRSRELDLSSDESDYRPYPKQNRRS